MVAVEQQDRAGHGAGIHAHSSLCIHLDDHKAFPFVAAAFHPLLQALQGTLLEFQHLLDMHAHNHRFRGCALRVDDHHVVEFIVAWREARGALVDFGGIFLNRMRGLKLEGMDKVLNVQHLTVLDLIARGGSKLVKRVIITIST
jgi:hypothetical protein